MCVCMLSCSVVSNSWRPHGLKPTRLLHPWDYPSKNTGEGCHFLLQWNLPNPGIEPTSPTAPGLEGGFLITELPWKPSGLIILLLIWVTSAFVWGTSLSFLLIKSGDPFLYLLQNTKVVVPIVSQIKMIILRNVILKDSTMWSHNFL